MGVSCRAADPKDSESALELIYGSAKDRFDYLFSCDGKTARDFIKYSFLHRSGLYSYTIHNVVTNNGEIVGIVSSYGCMKAFRLYIETLIMLLRFYRLRLTMDILVRVRKAGGHLPPISKDAVYGDNLCIEKTMRGKGIAILLIEYQFAWMRFKQYKVLYCDVEANNRSALRLYKRMGFELVKELQSNESCNISNMVRLRKKL